MAALAPSFTMSSKPDSLSLVTASMVVPPGVQTLSQSTDGDSSDESTI